jgi:2-phospho-L-lactate guanylyltransferase
VSLTVLVPVRDLNSAKSRLALPTAARRAITAAMLEDVLLALREAVGLVPNLDGTGPVDLVVLSNDEQVAWTAHRHGATVHPDPGGGIDAALRAATGAASGPVCVVMADLPCLRPELLSELWQRTAGLDGWVVGDADGTGTAILGASGFPGLRSSYGPGSRLRHALHCVDLTDDVAPALRCDVDTLEDLHRAVALGVGGHTAEVLSGPLMATVHLDLPSWTS